MCYLFKIVGIETAAPGVAMGDRACRRGRASMLSRLSRSRTARLFRCGLILAGVAAFAAACATPDDEPLQLPEARLVDDTAPVTIELAENALAEERIDDAKKMLERLVRATPDDPRVKFAVAELRLASGAADRAATDFDELIDIPEYRARAMQGRGIALLHLGQQEAAYEVLRGALAADDGLWRAWNGLGFYYDLHRDWGKAASAYGKAIEARPKTAFLYNNRGFSRIMQGELEGAVEDLDAALRLDSGFELARANLRLAVAWQGNYAHALSGVPEHDKARVLNNVGFIALLRGDYDAAEAYFLQAMETDPAFNSTAWKNLNYLNNIKELGAAEASRKP